MSNPIFLKSPYQPLIDGAGLPPEAVRTPPAIVADDEEDVPDAAPAAPAQPAARTYSSSDKLTPPPELRPLFEGTAAHFKVPVNVLMAIAHQESRYNPNAKNAETGATGMAQYIDATSKSLGIDASDPNEAIPAAAMQLRERMDKGMSIEDAIKEHFAGPNRKLWGAKTAAYGDEVMGKARAIGQELYGDTAEQAPEPAPAGPRPPDAPKQNQFSPGAMSRDDYKKNFIGINPNASPAAVDAALAQYDQKQAAARSVTDKATQMFGPKALPTTDEFFQQRLDKKLAAKDPRAGGIVPALPSMPTDGPAPQPASIGDESAASAAGSYLGHSVTSGLYNLAGAGAKLLDAVNPFTLSDSDAATLFKDDPAKLKQLQDESLTMGLSRFAKAMQSKGDAVMGDVSPRAKRDYGNLEYETLDKDKAAYLSPVKVLGDGVRSLPSSLALMVSAYLTRGASVRAEQAALAAGMRAEVAREAGITAGAKMMAQVSAGGEGGIGYAQQSLQTDAEASKVPMAELRKSPAFQQLLRDGYTPATARAKIIADTAEHAGQIAGLVDAATNKVGGEFLGKIISEGGPFLRRVLSGAANESITEGVQSAGEQVGQNFATQQNIDPNQNLGAGVGEAAIAGAAVGGMMGGATAGVAGHPAPLQPQDQGAPPAPAQAAAPAPAAIPAQAGTRIEPTLGAPADAPLEALAAPTGKLTPRQKLEAIRGPNDGAPIVPADPEGPLMDSLHAAAAEHEADPAPLPAAPEPAPEPPSLDTLPLEDLQGQLKQVATQQKTADPAARKELQVQRKAIEKAINAKKAEAKADSRPAEEPLVAGPFDDMKQANKMMLRHAESTGAAHEVVPTADGQFRVQRIEGGGDGVDTAGGAGGTDGRGRSGRPAGADGAPDGKGTGGTGDAPDARGRRDMADQRLPDAAGDRVHADHPANATDPVKAAHVPEPAKVPEEAPAAKSTEGEKQAAAAGDAARADGKDAAPAATEPVTRDTRGAGVRFHGTSREMPGHQPNNEFAMSGDNRNIYGQGFYTTDAADISEGYMRKGKGKAPTLYEVKERGTPKLYDMEQPLTDNVRKMAERAMGDEFPESDIDGRPITSLRALLDEFRAESQNNGLTRDDVQEVFDAIRYNLEKEGYHGYRHIGGAKTGKAAHDVRIYWTPEDHIDVEKSDIGKYKGEPAAEKKTEAPQPAAAEAPAATKKSIQDESVRQAAESMARRKVEREAAPASPIRTAGERMRAKVKAENPFMAFLSEHGIHVDERSDTGAEKARHVMVPGYGNLYRKAGLRIDELAGLAHESGFLSDRDMADPTDNGGTRKLADMIERAAHRKEVIGRDEPAAAPGADAQLMEEAEKLGIDIKGRDADQIYDEVVAAHADEFSNNEARLAHDAMLDADIPLDGGKSFDNLSDEDIDAIFGIKPKGARADGGQDQEGADAPARKGTAESGAAREDGSANDAGRSVAERGERFAVEGRKEDPYTVDLFGGQDLFDDIEVRPNTLPAQKETARAAVSDLAKRLGVDRIDRNNPDQGSKVSVLGARLLANFVEGKPNQLIGQKIASPHDLAVLAQVYRDPRFETIRVFYTNGDDVVGEAGYSSRLPAAVHLPNDIAERMRADKARFDADGYYLSHNHPSGRAEPSPADQNFTNHIDREVPGFRSHVVIDHNEYAVIQNWGSEVIKAPHLNGKDFTSMPEVEHALLGVKADKPEVVAFIAKALQVPDGYAAMVLANTRGETNLIVDVPMAAIKDAMGSAVGRTKLKALLRRMGRESGSGTFRFLVMPKGHDVMGPTGTLVARGIFTDVVNGDGHSATAKGMYQGGDFMQTMRRKTIDVRDEARQEDAEHEVEPLLQALADKGAIVLHDDASTLPGKGPKPDGVQALTAPDGTIHVVANALHGNALGVVLHEAFHAGAKPLLGTKVWDDLQQRLGALYRQGERSTGAARVFFDKARERVATAKARGAVAPGMEHEEFGAYAIEEYASAPASVRKWVDDLVGTVKAWALRRFGRQLGRVTPAQLSSIAKLALMDKISARAEPAYSTDNSSVDRSKWLDGFNSVFPSKAARFESAENRLRSNAKQITDMLVSPTFTAKGLGALEVPAQRKVLSGVLRLADNSQVRRSIVEFIPVDVVNILARKQLSADSLLSDQAVLRDFLSADSEGAVATAVDVARALRRAITFVATKYGSTEARMSEGSGETNRAPRASIGDGLHSESVDEIKSTGNSGDGPDIRYSVGAPATPTVPTTMREKLAELLKRPIAELRSVAHDIGVRVVPMSVGSDTARAMAKDFANQTRQAQAQWHAFDKVLREDFTTDQLQDMWHAADQENDLRRDGKTSKTKGLNSLPADQREVVELLHSYGEQLWDRAKKVGLINPDRAGVHYWTPRVAANIYADGSVDHIAQPGGEFSKDATNLKTSASSTKHRKYETTAEAEAAGKAGHGDDFAFVKNIRVMPLAMAQMERAIAGRSLVNQVKAQGQIAGMDLISDRKLGKNYETFDHPALKRWMPKTDWSNVDPADLAAKGHTVQGKQVLRADGTPLKTYRVDAAGNVQKLGPMIDSEGQPVLLPMPLYVHKDFVGPLKSVLKTESPLWYQHAMRLKGGITSMIMISPLTHNLVIWGKAMPTMASTMGWKNNLKNIGTAGIHAYVVGYQARQNHALMKELIGAGLVPVSGRGMSEDVTGIAQGIEPGRSWTAKAAGRAVGLVEPATGPAARAAGRAVDAVAMPAGRAIGSVGRAIGDNLAGKAVAGIGQAVAKAGRVVENMGTDEGMRKNVDALGELWHETLLWNRVADMQAGMAVMLRTSLMDKGFDQDTASRFAAHFANRYAGMVPQEAMSQGAHMLANLALFSKSFNMTNVGAFKDAAFGLPADVQAQIVRNAVAMKRAAGMSDADADAAGRQILSKVQKTARIKGSIILALDIAAMTFITSLAQALWEGQGADDIKDDFVKRAAALGHRFKEDPLTVAMQPLQALASLSQGEGNAPGKEDRVRLGSDKKRGDSYYMRLPMGKMGEELKNYMNMTTAMRMLHNKMSTFARPFADLFGGNEDFQGQSIVNPDSNLFRQAAQFGAYWVKSQLPAEDIMALARVANGSADTMDQAKLLGTATGLTVARVSGGDAVAEMRKQTREIQDKLRDTLPEAKEALRRGKPEEARKMLIDAGQTPQAAQRLIMGLQNPGLISKGKMRAFLQHATPEEREKVVTMMRRK